MLNPLQRVHFSADEKRACVISAGAELTRLTQHQLLQETPKIRSGEKLALIQKGLIACWSACRDRRLRGSCLGIIERTTETSIETGFRWSQFCIHIFHRSAWPPPWTPHWALVLPPNPPSPSRTTFGLLVELRKCTLAARRILATNQCHQDLATYQRPAKRGYRYRTGLLVKVFRM